MPQTPFAERNGWRLFAHPSFGDPLSGLIAVVKQIRGKQHGKFASHPKSKAAQANS